MVDLVVPSALVACYSHLVRYNCTSRTKVYAMVAPIWPLGFVMLVQGVMIAHVEYICGSDVSLPEGLSITTDLVLELPSLLQCYCTYAACYWSPLFRQPIWMPMVVTVLLRSWLLLPLRRARGLCQGEAMSRVGPSTKYLSLPIK